MLALALEQLSDGIVANSNLSRDLEAKILLAYVLKCTKEYLWAYPEKEISQQQEKFFMSLIARRASGEPIAYITGSKEFWSLDLKVTKDVLIPRADTELLIEIILKKQTNERLSNQNLSSIDVLDLGTGSGAIGLALASEQPDWHITAVDFSKPALEIAKYNAEKNSINNISFVYSDWFENISQSKKFNIIVSNPPYIEKADQHLCQGDLRFEPETALVSGKDGLDDIRKIIINAQNYLKPNGLLILEHGYNQAERIQTILLKDNYLNIETHQDLAGLNRVTCATFC